MRGVRGAVDRDCQSLDIERSIALQETCCLSDLFWLSGTGGLLFGQCINLFGQCITQGFVNPPECPVAHYDNVSFLATG
jgi:hypothetical protein